MSKQAPDFAGAVTSIVSEAIATTIGDNAAAELKRRVDRRLEVLDQIAELQETLKGYKAEDKADGYTEKAIGVVIKGLRGDAEDHANQLTFEGIVDTYRKACGLPVDLEAAYARVRESTDKLPKDGAGSDHGAADADA